MNAGLLLVENGFSAQKRHRHGRATLDSSKFFSGPRFSEKNIPNCPKMDILASRVLNFKSHGVKIQEIARERQNGAQSKANGLKEAGKY